MAGEPHAGPSDVASSMLDILWERVVKVVAVEKGVFHHEEHEGHEGWIKHTDRARDWSCDMFLPFKSLTLNFFVLFVSFVVKKN